MQKLFKRIVTVIVFISIVFSITSCSSSKPLVIGIEDDDMPLSGTNSDDDIDGYIVELAREATKRMGRDVVFKFVDINKGADNFSSQGVDAIWGKLSKTEDNSKTMNFTKNYFKDNEVVLVLNGSLIEKKADLKGKKIGTVSTSVKSMEKAEEEYLGSIDGAKSQKYFESVTAKLSLDNNNIDALIVEESYARSILTQHAEQYRLLDDHISENEYSVAVRRNDSRLKDSFESALTAMINDGTAKSISKKWFSIDMTSYD